MEKEILEEKIISEKQFLRLQNDFSKQQNDYLLIKEKTKKLYNSYKVLDNILKEKDKQYKVLDNILKEKDKQYKEVLEVIDKQKQIIKEKEIEIENLNKLNLISNKNSSQKIFIGQQNEINIEKDKKINELMLLCNEFEERLNSQDEFVKKYEEVIEEYKKQLMKSNSEKNLLIKTLQEQKQHINLITRKNKELTNELSNYKKD
jgi:chromosome segregation ATPase